MALVSIHRGSRGLPLNTSGAQIIQSGGSFNLDGYVVFELDPTVYNQIGEYVLIDYSAGSFLSNGLPAGQTELTTYAIVDSSLLTGLSAETIPTDDPINKRITVNVQ